MSIAHEFANRQLSAVLQSIAGRELNDDELAAVANFTDSVVNSAVDKLKETVNLQQQEINSLNNRIEGVEAECNATIHRMQDELNRLTPRSE